MFRRKEDVCTLEGAKLFDSQVYFSAKATVSNGHGLYDNRKKASPAPPQEMGLTFWWLDLFVWVDRNWLRDKMRQ